MFVCTAGNLSQAKPAWPFGRAATCFIHHACSLIAKSDYQMRCLPLVLCVDAIMWEPSVSLSHLFRTYSTALLSDCFCCVLYNLSHQVKPVFLKPSSASRRTLAVPGQPQEDSRGTTTISPRRGAAAAAAAVDSPSPPCAWVSVQLSDKNAPTTFLSCDASGEESVERLWVLVWVAIFLTALNV